MCPRIPLLPILPASPVFDKTKLSWMNGQHLRGMPADELAALVGGRWVASGLLARAESPFVAAALAIVQNSLELVAGAWGRGGGSVWLLELERGRWARRGGGGSQQSQQSQHVSLESKSSCPPLHHPHAPSDSPPAADADRELRALLSYPLAETLGSEAAKAVVEDNFQQVGGRGGQGRGACCKSSGRAGGAEHQWGMGTTCW